MPLIQPMRLPAGAAAGERDRRTHRQRNPRAAGHRYPGLAVIDACATPVAGSTWSWAMREQTPSQTRGRPKLRATWNVADFPIGPSKSKSASGDIATILT